MTLLSAVVNYAATVRGGGGTFAEFMGNYYSKGVVVATDKDPVVESSVELSDVDHSATSMVAEKAVACPGKFDEERSDVSMFECVYESVDVGEPGKGLTEFKASVVVTPVESKFGCLVSTMSSEKVCDGTDGKIGIITCVQVTFLGCTSARVGAWFAIYRP